MKMTTRRILLFILFLLLLKFNPFVSFASDNVKKDEGYYQDIDCRSKGGEVESRIEGQYRVDCLTKHEAIEHDWEYKWAECVGQALYYGAVTDKQPVCVIIGSYRKFQKRRDAINKINEYYGINIKVEHIRK